MEARHALARDTGATCSALARAFADDPMMTWLLGTADAAHRVELSHSAFFVPSVAAGLQRGHTYLVPGSGATAAAAAVWSPPDVTMFTEAEVLELAAAVGGAGEQALERLVALGELVEQHHPADPHFYLFLLGAAEKGTGAGSRALQPVLERCDLDGIPAYLESSTARNLSFYERHGFGVVWEDRPAADGPMMRGMWRPPGSRRG